MKPQTIGRVLGVGLRVAGRIAGQQLSGEGRTAAPRPVGAATYSGAETRAKGQAAGRATVQVGKGVKQGVGGFLRPFQRVGGIIWLEVAGVFFLLPVLVFSPIVWQTRADWAHGPDHRKFLSAAIVVGIFFYLGVTSFLRARKRSRG